MWCLLFRLLAPSALAVLVIASGCGDDTTDTQSETPGEDSSQTPFATTDIDPATGLPRTFPGEFPVLAGATVSRASEYTDRYVIEWRATDSYEDATAYYTAALAAGPWRTDSTQEDENATVFEISGGSAARFDGSLAVAKLDDGVRILLNLIRD